MLARVDQSAPWRQYLDRIEELEEQVRQLRTAFAPKVGFSLSWELAEQESAILSALFNTAGSYVTAEALRLLIVGFDDNAGEGTVQLWVGRLRRKVGRHRIGIETRTHQGYALDAAGKVVVAKALGRLPAAQPRQRAHPRAWVEAEDAIIRAGYRRRSLLTVIRLDLIGAGYRARSVSSISVRAQHLGLTHDRAADAWAPDEDAVLRAGYAAAHGPAAIRSELAKAGFVRTRAAIQCRARDLGITAAAAERWTDAQIAILRRRYAEKVPVRRIAAEIGRPIPSVHDKASDLGLKMRWPWKPEDRQRVIDGHAAGESAAVIAAAINRPRDHVFALASRLGLRFSREGQP